MGHQLTWATFPVWQGQHVLRRHLCGPWRHVLPGDWSQLRVLCWEWMLWQFLLGSRKQVLRRDGPALPCHEGHPVCRFRIGCLQEPTAIPINTQFKETKTIQTIKKCTFSIQIIPC